MCKSCKEFFHSHSFLDLEEGEKTSTKWINVCGERQKVACNDYDDDGDGDSKKKTMKTCHKNEMKLKEKSKNFSLNSLNTFKFRETFPFFFLLQPIF